MEPKIALVTGASGGLGTSVVKALLDAEMNVIGVSRNITSRDFQNPAFVALPGSLSTLESSAALVGNVIQRFGRIDVLAHLVGGFDGGKPIVPSAEASLRAMFDVNLFTAFYVLRAVLPHMRRQQGGRIIAIGSRAAESPGPGVGAYSASKAAIVSLIRTVALENGKSGITANVLLPGTIDTPANRAAMPDANASTWVQPSSIASLIVWLAGDAGSDVNGAVIPVYGMGG